ncbi:Nn.00g002370.m01.CDS01 [Neocucurbitaria sp. VM-36]
MAARSRPRGGQLKDEFDEERSIWNSIKSDGKRVDQLMREAEAIRIRLGELNTEQDARIGAFPFACLDWLDLLTSLLSTARGAEPSSRIDDELEKNLREDIRLCNEIQTLLQPIEGGNDICTQLTLLSALRASEEVTSSASRATSVGGKSGRDRQGKRKLTDVDDRDSIAADSPGGPSPKVVISSQKDRLVAKSGSSRAGSVPVREGSVKVEDDKDDMGKDARPRLSPQTEVLYRNNAKNRSSSSSANYEGEGILCRVTSVIGEGKQRRYEIIDADPDPPTPSMPYRASVNHLIPIPPLASNMTLPDLPKGRNVLALYPGTTTFYKAEVVAGWKVSDWKVKKEDGGKEGEQVENLVRLRFEGEDEADREMSVERSEWIEIWGLDTEREGYKRGIGTAWVGAFAS